MPVQNTMVSTAATTAVQPSQGPIGHGPAMTAANAAARAMTATNVVHQNTLSTVTPKRQALRCSARGDRSYTHYPPSGGASKGPFDAWERISCVKGTDAD